MGTEERDPEVQRSSETKPLDANMKTCTKCGKTLPVDNFYKGKARCKSCIKAVLDANREEGLAKRRDHYFTNREVMLENMRAYRAANREDLLEKARDYHQSNREVILAKQKRYYAANREARLEKVKAYYVENREAILEKAKAYHLADRERHIAKSYSYFITNRENLAEKQRESRIALSDVYVKQRLCRGSGLRHSDIPRPLVELKKAQLRILRELRKEET